MAGKIDPVDIEVLWASAGVSHDGKVETARIDDATSEI
jgi:hypothetical protein